MRSIVVGLAAWALSSAGSAQQDYIPDHERTPGAINLEITQENIAETVCIPGYTKTIRPPSSYTEKLKQRQMGELGLGGTSHDYREDHLVPLCVGGAQRDPHNLWPQPATGQWSATVKNQLEASVCRQVCRGDITLKEGQAIFLRRDWTKAYLRFFRLEPGAGLDCPGRNSACCSLSRLCAAAS